MVFFHQVGRVLGDRQPRRRRDQEGDAARLTEPQRGGRVAVDERLLDGGLVRSKSRDDVRHTGVDLDQAICQRSRGIGAHHAIAEVSEPVAVDDDHSPPGLAQPRIQADQPHALPTLPWRTVPKHPREDFGTRLPAGS